MVTIKTVTYECEICGTELVVKESGEGYPSPIYLLRNRDKRDRHLSKEISSQKGQEEEKHS